MNKNILLAFGIGALVIILGIAGFMFLPKKAEKSKQTAQTATTAPEKMSLTKLMGTTGNQSCMFTDASSNTSGTMYFNEGKVRGDFTSQVEGTKYTSHILSDTKKVYIWTDGQKNGISASAESVGQIQGEAMKEIDMNKDMEYSCTDWKVDAAKFTLPTAVTFADYTDMMKNVSEMMKDAPSGGAMTPNNPASACSACDSMEGEAKTACQSALKCN